MEDIMSVHLDQIITKEDQDAFLTSLNGNKCDNNDCKETINLKVCAGCKIIQYCSSICQKQHWKEHKKLCKKIINTTPKNIVKPKNTSNTPIEFPSRSDAIHYESYVSANPLTPPDLDLVKYTSDIVLPTKLLNVMMDEIPYEIRMKKALVFIKSIKYGYFILEGQTEWIQRVSKSFPKFVSDQKKCKRIIIIKNEKLDKEELVTTVCNCTDRDCQIYENNYIKE